MLLPEKQLSIITFEKHSGIKCNEHDCGVQFMILGRITLLAVSLHPTPCNKDPTTLEMLYDDFRRPNVGETLWELVCVHLDLL